jgi:hypothetical protein
MKAQDLILNVSRRVYTYEKIQIVNYENLRVHIECMVKIKRVEKTSNIQRKRGSSLLIQKLSFCSTLVHIFC